MTAQPLSTGPFIASRSGHVIAYRLAGIRRRGLTPDNPRYWFVEFNPKSGLGIITDQPGRFSLQRGLAAPDGVDRTVGLHFVPGRFTWRPHTQGVW